MKNVTDFLGMLVFDKRTCNCDGRQTLFYQTDFNAPFETVMIDQGFCFKASEWNFPDSPLRGLHRQCVVYQNVQGVEDFEPWLTKLEQINEAVLIETAKTIPPEWYDTDCDSLQRLLEQLDRRRNGIRELLWETWKARRYAFPNWNEQICFGVQSCQSNSLR